MVMVMVMVVTHNDKKRCRHTMIGIVVANFVVFLFLLFLLVVALAVLAVLIAGVGCWLFVVVGPSLRPFVRSLSLHVLF